MVWLLSSSHVARRTSHVASQQETNQETEEDGRGGRRSRNGPPAFAAEGFETSSLDSTRLELELELELDHHAPCTRGTGALETRARREAAGCASLLRGAHAHSWPASVWHTVTHHCDTP